VKLHIIGIPSAGKTTLAKGMSRLLSVPFHDLDSLAFVDERWTLRPIPERDDMVARILEEPSFVSEGGFLGWTEALFAAADHIVWLDPPLRVLVWRHVRRHRKHPWLLPSLLRFQVLMYLRSAGAGPATSDPDQTRAGIESALRPWAYKVLRVTRPVSAADLMRELDYSRRRETRLHD
jgi:shikimate kinase